MTLSGIEDKEKDIEILDKHFLWATDSSIFFEYKKYKRFESQLISEGYMKNAS